MKNKIAFLDRFACGWASGIIFLSVLEILDLLNVFDFVTTGKRILLKLILGACWYGLSYLIALKYFED